MNKKEDVIDLQLTQYGKYLVSQGKFKPVYYAFFDDDIIYDQRYASGSVLEVQKDIETRILESTPSMEAQYLFHTVDNLKPQDQLVRIDSPHPLSGFSEDVKEKLQQVPDKYFTLTEPLGTSELTTNKAPSFSIQFRRGEITGSRSVLTGSDDTTYSTRQIPQLDIKNVITYAMVKSTQDTPMNNYDETYVFPDYTYIAVDASNMLSLSIKEENVPLSKDNFDIEVFILDDNGNIDFPLSFKDSMKQASIEDGILIDAKGEVTSPGDLQHFFEVDPDELPTPGADMVEAYFNIRTDRSDTDW